MRQRLGQRVSPLARRAEFRPVVSKRRIIVDQPALHEHRHDQRRHRLGRRIDRAQRALIPHDTSSPIREPAAKIDNKLVAKIGREAGTMLEPLGKVQLERRAHRLETGRGESRNAHAPHIVPQRLRVNHIVRNAPSAPAEYDA